jgi:hypothetical protein
VSLSIAHRGALALPLTGRGALAGRLNIIALAESGLAIMVDILVQMRALCTTHMLYVNLLLSGAWQIWNQTT